MMPEVADHVLHCPDDRLVQAASARFLCWVRPDEYVADPSAVLGSLDLTTVR